MTRKRHNVQRPPRNARWRDFLNSDELQRVTVLDERIERKIETLNDAYKERQLYMNRGCRRAQRMKKGTKA